MFSDLECDYINPIDLCNKLNQVWLISVERNAWLIHSLCSLNTLFMRLSGCSSFFQGIGCRYCWTRLWLRIMAISVALSWIPEKFTNLRPVVSTHRVFKTRHMYDATEIFRTLPKHKAECFVKLAFYLLSFFYCKGVHRCIVAWFFGSKSLHCQQISSEWLQPLLKSSSNGLKHNNTGFHEKDRFL